MTDEDRFSYGWHLIKSRYKDDVRKGIKIMGGRCGLILVHDYNNMFCDDRTLSRWCGSERLFLFYGFGLL